MSKYPLVYRSGGWVPTRHHSSHSYNLGRELITINAFEDIEVPIDHPDYIRLVQRRLRKGIFTCAPANSSTVSTGS